MDGCNPEILIYILSSSHIQYYHKLRKDYPQIQKQKIHLSHSDPGVGELGVQ